MIVIERKTRCMNNIYIFIMLERRNRSFLFPEKPLCSMFILTEVEDTVKIEPKSFSKTDNEAIQDVLNYKFANKVKVTVTTSFTRAHQAFILGDPRCWSLHLRTRHFTCNSWYYLTPRRMQLRER